MKKLVSLLGFVALAQSAGIIGLPPTSKAIASGWYARLDTPKWRPPGAVFGPVWTILFVLMGVAAWRVWRKRDEAPDESKTALAWWGAQLALNAGWTWIFFGARKPRLALGEIVALWLAIAGTTRAFFRRDQAAGALMLPYLAWVSFAAARNASIAARNDN